MIAARAVVAAAFLATAASQAGTPPPLERFFETVAPDDKRGSAALTAIARDWKPQYAAMLLDMLRLFPPAWETPALPEPLPSLDEEPRASPFSDLSGRLQRTDRGAAISRRLILFLEKQTGQRLGDNLDRWREWAWKLPYDPHPDYAAFKGLVYQNMDPRMRAFFPPGIRSAIRLDEIDWGGVRVNGIPPLRYPKTLTPSAAAYLKDSNIVFGLVVNGEARAYPKRILAWHEMAIDRLGGVELTVVYCTLCGTVIPFESDVGGRLLRFGTSGLLYRSNKLMFDEDSNSLWSTFEGIPVVGPLVGSSIRLRSRPVVTTTWKEWRTAHPSTSVLSLDTGHKRDYSEGAAYRDYFNTDRLMFPVSNADSRLPNKAEVLVMQLTDARVPNRRVPVAVHADFLRRHPVYTLTAAGQSLLVVTSPAGANRVYRTTAAFPAQRESPMLVDADGRRWRVTESGLIKQADPSSVMPRVSAQRAFWFGWYAQFPDTLLFK